MTNAQREALEELLKNGLMQTTAHPRSLYLSGSTAKALVRRGWATRRASDSFTFWIKITEAGQAALAEEKARERKP